MMGWIALIAYGTWILFGAGRNAQAIDAREYIRYTVATPGCHWTATEHWPRRHSTPAVLCFQRGEIR